MKDRAKLRELAQQHGVKTTKRVWFDKIENGQKVSSFIDLDRPVNELADELKEMGVMQ